MVDIRHFENFSDSNNGIRFGILSSFLSVITIFVTFLCFSSRLRVCRTAQISASRHLSSRWYPTSKKKKERRTKPRVITVIVAKYIFPYSCCWLYGTTIECVVSDERERIKPSLPGIQIKLLLQKNANFSHVSFVSVYRHRNRTTASGVERTKRQ